MKTCPDCDGTGTMLYTCCGDDVRGTMYEDWGLCPTCKDHCSPEDEECDTCNGTGEITIQESIDNTLDYLLKVSGDGFFLPK